MTLARAPLEFDAFVDLMLVELGLPALPLRDETRLVEELGFDSVLMFELLLVIEDWIGVMLPEALIGQFVTAGDVYDIYRTRIGHR